MLLAIVQARTSSSRLPGKVLKPILGKPMLALQLERVGRAKRVDRVVVATSDHPDDAPIVELCARAGVASFRGSLEDVLTRFASCARAHQAKTVVRLTGDCPLADAGVIDATIERFLEGGADYVSNTQPPTYPDGLDVEVFSMEALLRAEKEAKLKSEREHVTPYLYAGGFRCASIRNHENLAHHRWTVDDARDLDFVTRIFEGLYSKNPAFSWKDVLTFLAKHPEIQALNSGAKRNEGYEKSLRADELK